MATDTLDSVLKTQMRRALVTFVDHVSSSMGMVGKVVVFITVMQILIFNFQKTDVKNESDNESELQVSVVSCSDVDDRVRTQTISI